MSALFKSKLAKILAVLYLIVVAVAAAPLFLPPPGEFDGMGVLMVTSPWSWFLVGAFDAMSPGLLDTLWGPLFLVVLSTALNVLILILVVAGARRLWSWSEQKMKARSYDESQRRLMNAPMRFPRLVSVVLGFALGFGIWVLAGFLTSGSEPWDGNLGVYMGWQVVGGLHLGLLAPRLIVWSWLLFFAGQVVAVLLGSLLGSTGMLGVNLFLPVGLFFLAIYSLPCLLALMVGRVSVALWVREKETS